MFPGWVPFGVKDAARLSGWSTKNLGLVFSVRRSHRPRRVGAAFYRVTTAMR
jgi:hypothetical protein